MAKIICKKCGAEYDEFDSVCPICGEASKAQELSSQDAQNTQQSATFENEIGANFETQQNDNYSDYAPLANESETETDENPKSNTLVWKIIIGVLAAGIIGLVVWMLIGSGGEKALEKDFGYYESDTVLYSGKLNPAAIEGKYLVEDASYYNFTIEETEIEVAPREEALDEATENSAADETAKALSALKKMNGRFEMGTQEASIPERVAIAYIQENKMDDYSNYAMEAGLTEDDPLGYIEARGLGEELNAYDLQNGITESIKADVKRGYWALEGKKIYTYDENGNPGETFIVTKSGLVIENYAYVGKAGKGKNLTGVFTLSTDTYKEEIHFYDDGYCVIDVGQQLIAGNFVVTPDGMLTITVDGRPVEMKMLKECITTVILEKE